MLPLTHAWSRAQKCLLIAAVLIALAAFGTLVQSVERRYRPPDGNILAGTWEMTAPYSKDSSTVLRLDPERTAAWHSGAWVRYPAAGAAGLFRDDVVCWRSIHLHALRGGLAADLADHPNSSRRASPSPCKARLHFQTHLTQAMQRTASKAPIHCMSICYPLCGCESHFTGLAVADLVSR